MVGSGGPEFQNSKISDSLQNFLTLVGFYRFLSFFKKLYEPGGKPRSTNGRLSTPPSCPPKPCAEGPKDGPGCGRDGRRSRSPRACRPPPGSVGRSRAAGGDGGGGMENKNVHHSSIAASAVCNRRGETKKVSAQTKKQCMQIIRKRRVPSPQLNA